MKSFFSLSQLIVFGAFPFSSEKWNVLIMDPLNQRPWSFCNSISNIIYLFTSICILQGLQQYYTITSMFWANSQQCDLIIQWSIWSIVYSTLFRIDKQWRLISPLTSAYTTSSLCCDVSSVFEGSSSWAAVFNIGSARILQYARIHTIITINPSAIKKPNRAR